MFQILLSIMKPDIIAHADVIELLNEYTEQVQYGLVDDLLAHAEAPEAKNGAVVALKGENPVVNY